MKDYKDLKVGQHKGIPSNEHWEVKIQAPSGENDDPAKSFLPMSGAKRAQPHQKVNECDH